MTTDCLIFLEILLHLEIQIERTSLPMFLTRLSNKPWIQIVNTVKCQALLICLEFRMAWQVWQRLDRITCKNKYIYREKWKILSRFTSLMNKTLMVLKLSSTLTKNLNLNLTKSGNRTQIFQPPIIALLEEEIVTSWNRSKIFLCHHKSLFTILTRSIKISKIVIRVETVFQELKGL